MTDSQLDGFVPFVLDRAGEAVRSVVRYDADSSEVLFLRDDVAEVYSALTLETVMTSLRREGEQAGRQEHLYAHGGLNCIIRAFDGGLEMHFPYGDSEGVAVALEPRAAQQLYRFVDDCLEHVSPPLDD
jgi:hypothetical protein